MTPGADNISIEAEQSVIGAILLEGASALAPIGTSINRSDFRSADHRLIFSTAQNLAEAGNPIDVLLVAEALERAGSLHSVGGLPYLGQLAANAPSVANIQRYAEIVRAAADKRRALSLALEIKSRISAGENPVDVLTRALTELDRTTPAKTSLSVVMAADLPDIFTPADELIEGVLTLGGGSVLYGDSNSGKTFLAIDLSCAVARGVCWFGKNVEQGLVVYLAAESPSSVRGRLQSYQRHHGIKVPNLAIVQNPIDLFDGDADTNKIIEVVRELQARFDTPVRLIVGDTLARLSAGANENAGQDMGLVVRRFDRIRDETGAHFMLVHHSGKSAAAGARGWSGMRAAVDTEIEITDTPSGRCAEITKQRDLSSKGDRIGFRLDTVTLGLTKWGAPATSCVVVPTDAPVKQKGKRISEIGGAIIEFLGAKQTGIKKRELVAYFTDRYTKGAVYRELKRLVEYGQVFECAGVIGIGANRCE